MRWNAVLRVDSLHATDALRDLARRERLLCTDGAPRRQAHHAWLLGGMDAAMPGTTAPVLRLMTISEV